MVTNTTKYVTCIAFLFTCTILLAFICNGYVTETETKSKENVKANEITRYLNEGAAKYEQKDYNAATYNFDKALEIDPNNNTALYLKGRVLEAQEEYYSAIYYYDRALKNDNKNVNVLRDKASCLLSLKKYNESLDCCNRALETDNTNSILWFIKSECHHALRENEEALFCINKVQELYPDHSFKGYNEYTILMYKSNILRDLVTEKGEKKRCYELISCSDRMIEIASEPREELIPYRNKQIAYSCLGEEELSRACHNRCKEISDLYYPNFDLDNVSVK